MGENLLEAKPLRADMKLDQPEEPSGKDKKGDTPAAPTLDTRETEMGGRLSR